MATPPTAATQQDIQNSERLLDLSNQLLDSLNQRKKVIKDIDEKEKLYFATVKQQQKLSQDIAANAEKYLGYQIKSKDLAKQKKAVEDNALKSLKAFEKIEDDLANQRRQSLLNAISLRNREKDVKKQIGTLDLANDVLIQRRNRLLANGTSANNQIVRDIQQQIKENQTNLKIKERQVKNLQVEGQKQKDIAKSTFEIIKNNKEAQEAQKKEIEFLERNLKIRKQIEKSTGLLGGMAKAASKIPGIGQYLNADEAIDEMEKLAAKIEEGGGKATSFGNRMKIAGKGLQVLAKGAYENLKSPEAVFTFFIKAALTANDQAVKLGKSLGYAGEKADDFRENLVDIERASNNLNVTTKNLVEAFSELVTATGFAYEFTADQLETQIKLTKQVGLTADQSAQVQRFAVLNNKTSEETYRSFLKGITAARNQLKVSIDFKSTLAEAVMVSGQLAANLGNNPEIIGKAIVTAKALGMTLEQVAKAGESLLNFESSIENELKAELLTGKELNLERARAAALAGDQITLAEELNKQIGTASEFTKMNVLQQRALAESVGMTTDELANTLRKREEAIASGKSLAQITEEEAAQALERQSVQDKFNSAIEKLQSLIGNLLAGPLGGFLDILSGALNVVNLIGNALSFLATPLKVIAGVFGTLWAINKGILLTEQFITAEKGAQLGFAMRYYAWEFKNSLITKGTAIWESIKSSAIVAQIAKIPVLLGLKSAEAAIATETAAATVVTAEAATFGAATVWIVAGLAAIMGALAGYALADDMVDPGYGKRTLLSPEGSIKLNDNDTVIAGTNLLGGEKKENALISQKEGIQMPQIDLTPMIAAINEVKASVDRLYSKDTSINMDGKKVGTTLVQGSYKVA